MNRYRVIVKEPAFYELVEIEAPNPEDIDALVQQEVFPNAYEYGDPTIMNVTLISSEPVRSSRTRRRRR